MKRKKTSGPYSDPYTYGREQNFDSYTSNLDHLNGFRTAQDYASENAPGLGRTARKQVDGDKGAFCLRELRLPRGGCYRSSCRNRL